MIHVLHKRLPPFFSAAGHELWLGSQKPSKFFSAQSKISDIVPVTHSAIIPNEVSILIIGYAEPMVFDYNYKANVKCGTKKNDKNTRCARLDDDEVYQWRHLGPEALDVGQAANLPAAECGGGWRLARRGRMGPDAGMQRSPGSGGCGTKKASSAAARDMEGRAAPRRAADRGEVD
ncbi:hypothetical protein ABZP36_035518 [Zizania latifolia]